MLMFLTCLGFLTTQAMLRKAETNFMGFLAQKLRGITPRKVKNVKSTALLGREKGLAPLFANH